MGALRQPRTQVRQPDGQGIGRCACGVEQCRAGAACPVVELEQSDLVHRARPATASIRPARRHRIGPVLPAPHDMASAPSPPAHRATRRPASSAAAQTPRARWVLPVPDTPRRYTQSRIPRRLDACASARSTAPHPRAQPRTYPGAGRAGSAVPAATAGGAGSRSVAAWSHHGDRFTPRVVRGPGTGVGQRRRITGLHVRVQHDRRVSPA